MFKDDELHETRYCENCLKLQQELQEAMDNYVNLDLSRVKEYNKLVDKYKAKEQECEELKSDLTDLSKIIDCKNGTILTFKEQLDQLKAENKELKQYKTLYEKTRNLWNKARMNNYELLDEIKDLKDSLKRTVCQSECYKHKEADKLKQTLTEIKEIADKDFRHTSWEEYAKQLKQILQKISECEVRE